MSAPDYSFEAVPDQPKQVTRRSVLKGLAGIAAGAAVGVAADLTVLPKIVDLLKPYTPSASTTQPAPLNEPPSNHDRLAQKSLTTIQKRQETDFEPQAPFTKEFFERVRKSTYAIDIFKENGAGVAAATAWCARKEGNTAYFVTCKHVTEGITPKSDIKLWRPYFDHEKITPVKFSTAATPNIPPGKDLGVIKCELTTEQAANITPLPFRDNVSVKKGEKLMIVGYPGEFRSFSIDKTNFATSGEVAVALDSSSSNGDCRMEGLTNPGSSGSPFVVPDEKGEPVAIGVIHSIGGDKKTIGVSLEANQLMAKAA